MVGSFYNCCMVFFFTWREMVMVNFLCCDSLCSSLSVGKDTVHHHEGGEGHITAYKDFRVLVGSLYNCVRGVVDRFFSSMEDFSFSSWGKRVLTAH